MPSTAPRPWIHPVALAVAGAVGCGAGGTVTASDTLQDWRAYAGQGMRPDFAWSRGSEVAAPTVLSQYQRAQARTAAGALGSTLASLSFGFTSASVGAPSNAALTPLLASDRSRINSNFATSSFVRPVGSWGRYEVSALVARQRFASFGFGTAEWGAREDITGLQGAQPEEVSSGHGVRLAVTGPVSDTLQWGLRLQSRLDMDAFESFRGVYAEAGDFDIPARVETQLAWNMTPTTSLTVGVERVFYGDIDAFTSAALPTRFLSLLADGSAPAFAWRDLTIYSAEGAVVDATGGEWSLRYTTRQQPSPTSILLRRALEPEFTDTNVALAYRRAFGAFGQLSLAASYAPSSYFLGASTYLPRDTRGEQMEFEALWAIPF